MSVTALDTHEVVKTLRAAGFSEEQAEDVTRVVRDSQNIDLSGLATKADLAEAVAKMDAKLAETKVDIIKWVVGFGIAQTGFILAVVRFMH